MGRRHVSALAIACTIVLQWLLFLRVEHKSRDDAAGCRSTFFDGLNANGSYTEAKLSHAAAISCIRFFPRAQYIAGRYAGGKFVGYTASGTSVQLATIIDTPSLKWQLLNVSAVTPVGSVRYNSPDGGFGNMAEIEVYGRK